MAMEAQNSDPKRGHTIPAVEQPAKVPEKNIEAQFREVTKNLSDAQLMAGYRAFMDERVDRERINRGGAATEKSEETQKVPTVPLATGTGGGFKPPESDNVVELYPPVPPSPAFENLTNHVGTEADRLAHDRQERERADRAVAETNAQIDANIIEDQLRRVSKQETATHTETDAAKLDRMKAGNDAMIANNISQEKMIDAANTQPTPPSPAKDPSIIPPQTEIPVNHPAFENRHTESMLDTAARLGKNATEYVGDKLADSMQYGILGKLEPMIDRLGIRFFSAGRRKLFEGLYKWRSERAFVANEDLKKAEQVVAEKEKALAEQDAKRDAFLANEKKNGWSIGSSAIKFEEERRKAVNRIEAAKQNVGAMRDQLEGWNIKKAHWENRQKDVARNMVSKINLHPKVVSANADFLAANKVKEDITNQLQQWEAARTKAGAKLAQLEAKLKGDVSYVEEENITGQIDEIKKILEEGNKKHKEYVKKKNVADGRMQKINTYLGGWSNFSNELGRTGENNRYEDAGPAIKEKVAADRVPNQSHAPQA